MKMMFQIIFILSDSEIQFTLRQTLPFL
jgi:hypothetical protein